MKKVDVTLHIKTTVEVPDDYDDEMVLFWLNDSTNCIDNQIKELVKNDDGYDYDCNCCNTETTLGHEHETEL